MKIIIDLSNKCLSDNTLRKFTYEFWEDLMRAQTEHQFVIISSHNDIPAQTGNATLKRYRKTRLLWLDRLRYSRLVKAAKADRIITVDPQGFVIADGGQPKNNPGNTAQKRLLFAGYDPASVPGNMAAATWYPAMRQPVPTLSWTEAESIKTEFSGGRSFFLFTGDISAGHQLVDLLKAFSAFKKWQLSNMQLVIAGSSTQWTQQLQEKLASYKYKEDVLLMKDPDDGTIARLVAACYAMVYPAPPGNYPLSLIWCIMGHKAIVATSSETGRRLTNAAIWVHHNNTAEGFAQAMITLYKDENRQLQLAQAAAEQSPKFDRPQMLATAWRYIQQPLIP